MELSPIEKKRIQSQFDCFCKKVLRNEKVDITRQIYSHHNLLCIGSLSEKDILNISVKDEYVFEADTFNVLGNNIRIKNELLSTALNKLTKKQCIIILLSYCMDMKDREIGYLLNMLTGTVQYQRTVAIRHLRDMLEG